MRDLELRLGLPPVAESASMRIPRWRARIASVADETAFYAASFKADPLGTASTLLEWRDALIEAGWNGHPVAGGGDRLDALAAIENHDRRDSLPPGHADRLVRIEHELRQHPTRIYETIALVEDRQLWAGRWQRIFGLLEGLGTTFDAVPVDLPGAPAASDLGVLQSLLRDSARGNTAVSGDGSLLVLRGDTPAELAELTAAFLAQDDRAGGALVVRAADPAPLEAALARHGLAAQGHKAASAWRPAMQILPLAVELAFEPRDPYRLLELLTLPLGPFRGRLGNLLARAVSSQPGVGGQKWLRQKARAAELMRDRYAQWMRDEGKSDSEAEALAQVHVEERMARVAEWLEAPGASPDGAPRAHLLAVAERVRTWLQKRMGTADGELYAAAYPQAKAFVEALVHEMRETLTQDQTRELLDRLARSAHPHALTREEAGRVPHVDHPSALLAPCKMVIVWGFVADAARRPKLLPWNADERRALTAAGIALPDPAQLLKLEAEAWRRAILAASERVVLVMPGTVKGAPMAPHPLWDEIRARLNLDDAGAARITRHARLVMEAGGEGLAPVVSVPSLHLPAGRGAWQVDPALLSNDMEERGTSATSLEKLASCPLAWVLEERAKLRPGAITKVAGGPLLNGNISHRLVEELHLEGAFSLDEAAFLGRVEVVLDRLVRTEGATLFLPGASNERTQLVRQIQRALRGLHRYLTSNGFTIAAVEEKLETEIAIGKLHGRLDMRVLDREGRSAVIDLKWGASSYAARLREGRAVQLAAYAHAVGAAEDSESLPPAAYFALAKGVVISVDERMKASRTERGPSLGETWKRVEATVNAVRASYASGKIHVAATKRALPLLIALAIPDAEQDRHFKTKPEAACEYCSYDTICGRAWKDVA